MNEKTKVPFLWLIVGLFVGGSSIAALAAKFSYMDSRIGWMNIRQDKVESKQDKYTDDLEEVRNTLGRIEQKVEDLK